jgi:methylated-DNA-[protein]-cysteine S-methyltransferase
MYLERIPFPAGEILLVSSDNAVCALDYHGFDDRMMRLLHKTFGHVDPRSPVAPTRFRRLIEAFLDGDFAIVDTIPVDARGTEFQRTVWTALRAIPAGTTETYQQLAVRIGRPKAARAVGLANSQNPIAIIQPCHRVVGSGGELTGYAGGLKIKQWLLEHEGAIKAAATPDPDRLASAYRLSV